MKYGNCKLCGYEDNYEYLCVVYEGYPQPGSRHAYFCEDCRQRIFSEGKDDKNKTCKLNI